MYCVVNYVAVRDDFGAAEVFDRFLEITQSRGEVSIRSLILEV